MKCLSVFEGLCLHLHTLSLFRHSSTLLSFSSCLTELSVQTFLKIVLVVPTQRPQTPQISSTFQYQTKKTCVFPGFPGRDIGNTKFQYIPVFPGSVRTLHGQVAVIVRESVCLSIVCSSKGHRIRPSSFPGNKRRNMSIVMVLLSP